jgi:hypothetical protein
MYIESAPRSLTQKIFQLIELPKQHFPGEPSHQSNTTTKERRNTVITELELFEDILFSSTRIITTMAAMLGVQDPVTPPVSDGEIPAHYNFKDAKDLPEVLKSYIQSEKSKSSYETTPPDYKEHTIPFNAQFALNPRKLRIGTIGAGFSGLCMAHKLQHKFPELQQFVEHVIFEGRADIGGTWLVNDYPGVQCDVPSHIYVRVSSTYILLV